jgi:hypothetical protein
MTKSESILQAIQLLVSTALPTVTITRSRTARFGESELPAVNIMPGTDDAINHANQLNRHELTVTFEVYVKPQDLPDQAADPIIETIHQSLLNSSTLPLLVSHLQYKGRIWDFEDADNSALKLTITYAFTYINLANQL